MIRAPICNTNGFSAISHTETFPGADNCVMCRCDIPHSIDEHTKILSDGGQIVCYKPTASHKGASTPNYWERRRARDLQLRAEKKARVKL